jgi:hypothetical protein
MTAAAITLQTYIQAGLSVSIRIRTGKADVDVGDVGDETLSANHWQSLLNLSPDAPRR